MKNSNNNTQQNPVGKNAAEIINSTTLNNKIYTIRGVPVMLDADLAEIYGYETRYLNRQVFRNKEKFEGEDFMFQLTRKEADNLVMCQNVTSRNANLFKGQDGGTRKLPYAFTEQGIYMLMTVLKGELAVKQSRALVMAFKAMKDYIVESRSALEYRDHLRLLSQVSNNTQDILKMGNEIAKMDKKVRKISRKMGDVVAKSDLSPILLDFNKPIEQKEFLILDGQPTYATETFIDIYSQAIAAIFIVDNYINIKSLRLLQNVKASVEVTIFSDNLGHYRHQQDYFEFQREFPRLKVDFIRTNGKIHDRFIITDYGTENERIFQCGASSKDAGNKVTAIHEFDDQLTKDAMHHVVSELLQNTRLKLK